MTVALIKYNAGNTASVTNALLRQGISPLVTDEPEVIRAASHVIFPGVGHASPAMRYIRERGLDRVIPTLRQPFLGICLGLQLLCEWSEEGDTACLGVFPHKVRKFAAGPKVPHMGWNTVPLVESGLLGAAPLSGAPHFYFLHGYRADLGPATVAACEHGDAFSAIMRKGNFLATQFHPEKSGKAGAALLARFLAS
jgi:imidazole glycerol-phosphate synthase subunit HisH